MKIITVIGQLLILAFLGLVARECWRNYNEKKTVESVNKDGVLLRVRIDQVSNKKMTWRDYIGNSRYITFHYREKPYTIRYIQDTIFLQDGVSVPVVYSASNDLFIRPEKTDLENRFYKTSPLVKWTVIRLFSGSHAALFFALVLTAAFVVLALGFLATLTGSDLIRRVGNLLIVVCALGGTLFLCYDAWVYWRYYSHLKHEGTPATVRVEEIERHREFNNDRSKVFIFYVYQARVNFHGESRIIVVGEKDYDRTKAGDTLDVLYDANIDDMMSVNYSLLYHNLIFPLVFLVIVVFIIGRQRRTT